MWLQAVPLRSVRLQHDNEGQSNYPPPVRQTRQQRPRAAGGRQTAQTYHCDAGVAAPRTHGKPNTLFVLALLMGYF